MPDLMDRMFGEWLARPFRSFGLTEARMPALDIYEDDGHVVVETAMPGAKAEDIDVSVTGDTLTIKAESREEDRVKNGNYLRRELRVGSYRRSIHLPGGLETDDVDADYEDGILRLEFPKTEEAKARTIKVKPK